MGPHTSADGQRQRLELAGAVPESLPVCLEHVGLGYHPRRVCAVMSCHARRRELGRSWKLTSNRHLKPGQGWIEQVEIDLQPRCDDGSLPDNSYLVQWYNYLTDATHRSARPIAYQHNTRQMLQAAGFIDIQETIIRAPYTTWPSDPHQKEISRWYNLGITEGLEALSMGPFTRIFRWGAREHVQPLVEQVRKEIGTRKYHAYNNM